MNRIIFKSREDWLEYRTAPRIGASEWANIMGVGFRTPLETWASKRGVNFPIDPATEAMFRHGHEDEPKIAAWFESHMGCTLEDPGEYTVFEHADHMWLFATPDRTLKDDPVEFKSPQNDAQRKEFGDDAPLKFQIQLQAQMACMGRTQGWIVARTCPERVYHYEYDPQFFEDTLPYLMRFRAMIIDGTPPEPSGKPEDARVIARLHPEDPGTVIDLPGFDIDVELLSEYVFDTISEYGHSLEALRLCAKEAERMYEAARQRLMLAMGGHTYARCGEQAFSYKTQERKPTISVPLQYAKALELSNIPFTQSAGSQFRVLRAVKKLPKEIEQ
jgi:putative phage-type endonuclease